MGPNWQFWTHLEQNSCELLVLGCTRLYRVLGCFLTRVLVLELGWKLRRVLVLVLVLVLARLKNPVIVSTLGGATDLEHLHVYFVWYVFPWGVDLKPCVCGLIQKLFGLFREESTQLGEEKPQYLSNRWVEKAGNGLKEEKNIQAFFWPIWPSPKQKFFFSRPF